MQHLHGTLQHGERVCRLECRHVFHAACWGDAMAAGSRPVPGLPHTQCPNCRGPPRLIAVWHFIDSTRVTQSLEGV